MSGPAAVPAVDLLQTGNTSQGRTRSNSFSTSQHGDGGLAEPPSRPVSVDGISPLARDQDGGYSSKRKAAALIGCVTCATGITSCLAGVVIVPIPVIAVDLRLDAGLVLWPVSIYALTCGCTLLLCGSIADVVGSRAMYLAGCLLQCAFTLGCGLSKTGAQLIVFRGLSGVAASFCLPSAVSILNEAFPPGQRRNLAFAAMGGGQPVGFGLGLTLGGLLTSTIGWQWGFHVTAIVNFAVFIWSAWQLPRKAQNASSVSWRRLTSDIDWVGALIASTSLAMLLYILTAVTSNTSDIRHPVNITLLSIAIALLPAFVFWVRRQERRNRPALIPNSLWRNKAFTSVCINVFLVWGAFNAFEQIMNFFFQNVQSLSPLQAAIRFLPAEVFGILANIAVGLVVHRIRADWIVVSTTSIGCIAPLLMALVNPRWTYWAFAFPSVSLNPVGADGLFTVSNLLITSLFPAETQALAGGVFNTMAQIGKGVGVALAALIANRVTPGSSADGESEQTPEALMEAYRAAFWFCFGLTAISLFTSIWGLAKIGKVGHKRD